jgi:hypothetical protein
MAVLFFIIIMAEEIVSQNSEETVRITCVCSTSGVVHTCTCNKKLINTAHDCEELTNSGPGMSFLHTSSRGTPNFTLKMNSFQVLNEHLAYTNTDHIKKWQWGLMTVTFP